MIELYCGSSPTVLRRTNEHNLFIVVLHLKNCHGGSQDLCVQFGKLTLEPSQI